MNHVGRFAPSPTGNLHMGTLAAALGSFLRARQQAGRWLIRIDDIDPARERSGAARQILAGLARCGLTADAEPMYQSTRSNAYQAALDALNAKGLVFECWCSRRDLAEAGHVHRDGQCLHGANPDRAPALRLKVAPGEVAFKDIICGPQSQEVREEVGDFVLQRSDGCWSYHLACAVDEAFMGISEVVRGHDLLRSTPRQVLIQRLLGLPSPAYGHLPLVLDAGGNKFSKSNNEAELDLTDPIASLRMALSHLGQQPTPTASIGIKHLLQAAVNNFELAAVPVTRPASGA